MSSIQPGILAGTSCCSLIAMLTLSVAVGMSGSSVHAASPDAGSHWAFQPVAAVRPPPVQRVAWARNAIDRFILQRLEREGIHPAPEASRVTLIRRLTLDLIGLQPTPDEVESFLRDQSEDAYDRAVERLLASPHFGERWARSWLDAARYADSSGYSSDAVRSVWKYRDWVIQALNSGLPFDQFVIDQLAGDLLPDPTIDQRIATGFHRHTQINKEGGIDPEQFRVDAVMDRVDTTGTVFLGLTIGCAQCHDHKFDPFTQKEYYQLFAFFNNTVNDGHGKSKDGGLLEIPAEPGAKPVTTLVMMERDERRDSVMFVKGDFTRPGDRVTPGVPAILPPLTCGESDVMSGSGPASKPKHAERSTEAGGHVPNRLDLARWLVDPRNPLTSRVIVNRVWQAYFGLGIVATENDFGTQGAAPSHPELLDWLAAELISRQWDLKAIHRLILTSAAYRQSSRARPDLAIVDPGNKLLARQSRLRLEAESVRDVGLRASGLLSPRIGGPSVHPPQPDGVMNLGQVRRAWKASEGSSRYRRGLYTYLWRATPHPALKVFDLPDAFSACTRRLRSNTPLQALTLLNGEQFHELAQGLAARILRERPNDDQRRLEFAFEICVARRPDSAEKDLLSDLLTRELAGGDGDEPATPVEAWTTVARVLLNLDETITRE